MSTAGMPGLNLYLTYNLTQSNVIVEREQGICPSDILLLGTKVSIFSTPLECVAPNV